MSSARITLADLLPPPQDSLVQPTYGQLRSTVCVWKGMPKRAEPPCTWKEKKVREPFEFSKRQDPSTASIGTEPWLRAAASAPPTTHSPEKSERLDMLPAHDPGRGVRLIKRHTPNLTHLQLPAKPGTRAAPLQVPITDAVLQRAAKTRPAVPTGDELKEAWLAAVKGSDEYAHLLECKIERYLHDTAAIVDKTQPLGETDSHEQSPLRLIGFLWTPPYTPSLQPIEEFWGGAKNYCASQYSNGRKVRQCIEQLRVGWYGDGGDKAPLPCGKLVARAMADADRRMGEVGGLAGSMAAGVTVIAAVSAPQPVILPPERMPTDMTHRHIEAVDLTQDDDDEATPLTLTEEDHSAAQLTALDDGSAVLEDAPDTEGSTAPAGGRDAEPVD